MQRFAGSMVLFLAGRKLPREEGLVTTNFTLKPSRGLPAKLDQCDIMQFATMALNFQPGLRTVASANHRRHVRALVSRQVESCLRFVARTNRWTPLCSLTDVYKCLRSPGIILKFVRERFNRLRRLKAFKYFNCDRRYCKNV